jgi:hypothetical protein
VGYHGGSLVSLFDEKAQAATRLAARRMAERGTDRMHSVTVENTPIGGRALEGDGGGNLRSSWYTLPVQRVVHESGDPAYEGVVASNVDYAPHVEYGTGLWGPKKAKYEIKPKTPGGWLAWRGPNGMVYAKSVMHPGSPGQHMLQTGGFVAEYEADTFLFNDILNDWARAVEAGAD